MSTGTQWADLGPRLATGAAMAAVGVAAIWAGGVWFSLLVSVVSGLMIWELATMIAPERRQGALLSGALATVVVLVSRWIPEFSAVCLLLLAALIGTVLIPRHRVIFAAFAAAILIAGAGLAWIRDTYDPGWLIWLILVVIVTDVAGYFGGRLIGGPKFWPAVSPKKTWSGTVSGWIAAAAVGSTFWLVSDAGVDLPWISMALALFSQLGDIAESAVKRKMGVKDSSNLLPGHGGLMDRFDGLLAGALFMLLVSQLVYVPEVTF